MLLRLQDFNLNVKYKRGSQLYIADILSRAAQENGEHTSASTREASIYREIEAVHHMEGLNMKATTVERIRGDYEAEPSAKALKEMILIGWPETRSEVPNEIKAYFPHRDELTVDEGIVFKGAKVVIPPSLQKEMVEKTHYSHIGIGVCLWRARDVLFWPGMAAQIREFVLQCPRCN